MEYLICLKVYFKAHNQPILHPVLFLFPIFVSCAKWTNSRNISRNVNLILYYEYLCEKCCIISPTYHVKYTIVLVPSLANNSIYGALFLLIERFERPRLAFK